ncbi:NUDIX hydrolase [Streptomyces parvus]|uniref:NUDIX hydrolase n=1 Tax=Streptomyces parvus TaxID=66428 RepID=UPI0033C3EB60
MTVVMGADAVEADRLQRLAAYGIVRRDDSVLLVRIGPKSVDDYKKWMLPGGGVEHGEHPQVTVVREFKEETGYDVEVVRLLDVDAEHRRLSGPLDFHAVFALYEVAIVGGTFNPSGHGGVDTCAWISLAELPDLPLLAPIRSALEKFLPHVALNTSGQLPG